MKKIIGLITAVAVLCLAAGCGKKSEIIVSELSEALTENVSFSEQLTQIDTENIERRYALNAKDYSEITAYVGTAAVCDEFVIAKTSSPEAMKKKFDKYLEKKKESYEKYRSDEVCKLDNTIIEIYKDAIVMIVSSDTETVVDAYENYLKK